MPLAINLIVARFFLITLKPGNTPLITAIVKIEQGGLVPPDLAAYSRRLTGVWGIFLIWLGISQLSFGNFPGMALHPVLQFFIDPAAILVFFALEFAWRVHRFPLYRFASPWELWTLIRRNGGLRRIYHQCKT